MQTCQFGGAKLASIRTSKKASSSRMAVVSRAAVAETTSTRDIKVKVLTPEAQFMDNIAQEVILPTSTGLIGILPFHAPLITSLDIGVMLFKGGEKGDWTPYALFGGFALIQNNNVTILVNGAESVESIDVDQVKKDYEEAQAKFEKAMGGTPSERVEANMALKRARALVQLSD